MRAVALASALVILSACQSQPSGPPSRQATVTRPIGSWEGNGNRTIGFVSDSGRFRVSWETHVNNPRGDGVFRLTVHSAVSGRPIQLIADHTGAGSGTANVDDDPRHYNLMVESANLEWSIAVEEVVAASAQDY